jgi:hypothetical protein
MKKIHTNQVHGHKRPAAAQSNRANMTAVAVALCCMLAACGGGGGGSAGNTVDNNPSPQGTSTPQATAFVAMRWAVGPALYASGAITTYMPSIASIAAGKVMAVYAQSETGGNKLYATFGDLAAGTWTAPTLVSGYAGVVQGVNAIGGWALNPSATVVSADPVTGIATVAWTSKVAGESTYRVWISNYTHSSSTWSTPVQIGIASVPGLKITNSAVGGTLVGWLSASTASPGTQALNLYTLPTTDGPLTDRLELGASPYAAIKLGLSDINTVVAIWAGASQTVMFARKTGATWAAPVSMGSGAPASESDLDLVVNADGSDAVAWGGVDPSIHTVLHDPAGVQIASQLIVQGSVGNVRPALASMGEGKYKVVFAASSLSGVGVGYFEPYSSSYTPGAGWSTPLALYPTGVGGAGNLQLRVDTAGDALAVNLGYNINGYSFPSGVSAWTVAANIVYGGAIPAFVQEKSSGRGVILWCNGSQLQSAFFK